MCACARVPRLTQSKLWSPEDWALSFVLMFKRFSNAGVYSYCKHFYLQGQVYQHSTQLKSVIIYLRAFECRSVALAANQASVRSKATPKNSITRSGNCRSPPVCLLSCSSLWQKAGWAANLRAFGCSSLDGHTTTCPQPVCLCAVHVPPSAGLYG